MKLNVLDQSSVNQVHEFWRRFSEDAQALRRLPTDQLAEKLYAELYEVSDGLGILVSKCEPDIEVVFTAYAQAELAPLVEQLIQSAPRADGWRFVAFAPAADGPFVHEREGLVVDSTKVRFEPLQSASRPASCGIALYVPSAVLQHDECEDITWSLVSAAAGERLAMYIEHMEAKSIEKSSDDGLLPLDQLGTFLTWKADKVKM